MEGYFNPKREAEWAHTLKLLQRVKTDIRQKDGPHLNHSSQQAPGFVEKTDYAIQNAMFRDFILLFTLNKNKYLDICVSE